MREHMRWLLEWLHPDRNSSDWESVYAERVIEAWREAKAGVLPDTAHPPSAAPEPDPSPGSQTSRRRLRAPIRWIPVPLDPPPRRFRATIRIGAAVLIVSLAVRVIPRMAPLSGWLPATLPLAASTQ